MQDSVEVIGISKRFARISEASPTLRDVLAHPWRLLRQPKTEPFLALDDVSFRVQPGECIGILGRNGAGKSTLLKVLSRVTPPSAGKAILRGRTASLLEVGTGFHPELSGRENIYLSGSILGMSRQELREHFDHIVDYSGVASALDTPVKRYSSGMYLRLAFAIAANLPAEIVFLDEIIAVGDTEFQKKCFGTMSEGIKSGRTIFLVSHSIAAVHSICRRSIVLDAGRVVFDGPTAEAIGYYQNCGSADRSVQRPPQANGNPTIVAASVETDGAASDTTVIHLEIEASNPARFAVEIRILDEIGSAVAFGSLGFFNPETQVTHQGRGRELVRIALATGDMAMGRYRASLDLTIPGQIFYDRFDEGLTFEIMRIPKNGDFTVLEQAWRIGAFQLGTRRLD